MGPAGGGTQTGRAQDTGRGLSGALPCDRMNFKRAPARARSKEQVLYGARDGVASRDQTGATYMAKGRTLRLIPVCSAHDSTNCNLSIISIARQVARPARGERTAGQLGERHDRRAEQTLDCGSCCLSSLAGHPAASGQAHKRDDLLRGCFRARRRQ